MAYDNTVPQANQQIATTQPIIQANFAFLAQGIGEEHNFNSAGSGSDMYHKQASMPNMADPGALPAGTNGLYYVNGGKPKFYDGTTAYPLLNMILVQGSNLVNSGGAFQILPAGSYMGLVSVYRISDEKYNLIQFHLVGAALVDNVLASGASSNINLQLDGSNNLQLNNSSGSAQTYKWQVMYSVAP